jgi:hypothetical protein
VSRYFYSNRKHAVEVFRRNDAASSYALVSCSDWNVSRLGKGFRLVKTTSKMDDILMIVSTNAKKFIAAGIARVFFQILKSLRFRGQQSLRHLGTSEARGLY